MLLAHERKSKRWQKYTKNNKTATILTIIIGKNNIFADPIDFSKILATYRLPFMG